MSFGIFLLLFVVFFALIGVVIWVIRDTRKEALQVNELPLQTEELPDEADEAVEWLEAMARRQGQSGPRRLH